MSSSPKPKKEEKTAQIILYPCSIFLESTVWESPNDMKSHRPRGYCRAICQITMEAWESAKTNGTDESVRLYRPFESLEINANSGQNRRVAGGVATLRRCPMTCPAGRHIVTQGPVMPRCDMTLKLRNDASSGDKSSPLDVWCWRNNQ